jgi:hypothetical protein
MPPKRRAGRLFAVGCGLLFAGCFSLDEPICSYRCGDNGACPDHYSCMADGYCHKEGTSGSCLYSDAAVMPDQSAEVTDLSTPPDLASAPDQSVPDLLTPFDMSPASPDLTNIDM